MSFPSHRNCLCFFHQFHGFSTPVRGLFLGFPCVFDADSMVLRLEGGQNGLRQAGFEAFRQQQEALLELANSEADCELGPLGDRVLIDTRDDMNMMYDSIILNYIKLDIKR